MGRCVFVSCLGNNDNFCSPALSLRMSGWEVASENTSCRYSLTCLWTGLPRAANAFRVGWERTERWSLKEGRAEKPFPAANAFRSRTWSPIATAGLFSFGEPLLVIIPNGILATEKWLSAGIDSQERRGAMAETVLRRMELWTGGGSDFRRMCREYSQVISNTKLVTIYKKSRVVHLGLTSLVDIMPRGTGRNHSGLHSVFYHHHHVDIYPVSSQKTHRASAASTVGICKRKTTAVNHQIR